MTKLIKETLSYVLMSAVLFAGTISYANELVDTGVAEKAVKLAKRLQSDSLVVTVDTTKFENNLAALPTEEKVNYLRHIAIDSLFLRNQLSQSRLVEAYSKAALRTGNKREIALSNLYALYFKHSDTGGQFNDFEDFRAKIIPYIENSDWVISHRAKLFLAAAESYTLDLNTALSNALEAFNEIPNEQSLFVDEAVIESLDLIAYLHNLLNNPELAVDATEELINRRLEKGYEIDGISLLNNLIYSFGKWQDFETTSQLAEVLVALDTNQPSNVKGLSQLRLAQTLNDKSDYLGALTAINSIISDTNHKGVRANLLINKAVALAGLGRIAETKETKTIYDNFKTEINLTSNNLLSRELMAEALLAQANNDIETAFSKMRERYTISVQRKNTKERQAERESALKREANLKQKQLDQQKQRNHLLMLIATLLAISAVLAVIFARYRDKISKELAIKTLQAEDADRMKSEFLGMISHELRTPLNGIVGIADLLAMQAPTEDLRFKAGIILDSSNKLTHVIESIVDMSTIDGDKMELYPEPTNVHAIVTELDKVWRPEIEAKDVTFTSFVDTLLSEDIIIDKARFRQCLNSLLSNAAKFTDSGRVHLHVTATSIDETGETEVTAIVADTGQGMSETVQEKLFTPFLQADSTMTRKYGGSGLGLTITQSLARMMGGDVTLVSNQGRGSEFTMTVRGVKSDGSKLLDDVEELLDVTPLAEMEPATHNTSPQDKGTQDNAEDDILTLETGDYAPIELASSAPSIGIIETVDIEINTRIEANKPIEVNQPVSLSDTDNLRGLRVLIVEDITANQDIIKLFLRPEGCEILCASNGLEALDILNTQAVDIILMDIRMPTMDGIEATHAIRGSDREYKNTPIIALTADVAAETNAACMAAGADIFLTKPVIAHDLIESIRFIRRFQDYDEDDAASAA